LKFHLAGNNPLQFFEFNEEYLVQVSHQFNLNNKNIKVMVCFQLMNSFTFLYIVDNNVIAINNILNCIKLYKMYKLQ